MFNQIKKKKRELQESAWLLGICEDGFEDLKNNRIRWISNGKYNGKKWFADPFILDYDNKEIHLLVEEFDYKVHRGRIAKLTIDRSKWSVTDCKILLDLDTHLSFPMIWRLDDIIYICPENYKTGKWNVYKYNELEGVTFVKTLLEKPLTDAIILYDKKENYILSTCYPTPNGSILNIWKAGSLNGDYKKIQDIKFSENIARNAGMVFEWKGRKIRPAQECNESYGHAISFQELSIDEKGLLSFKEIYRSSSTHPLYKYGMHTFNQSSEGMAVIDVKGFRHPMMGPFLKSIQRLFVKIGMKEQYRPK